MASEAVGLGLQVLVEVATSRTVEGLSRAMGEQGMRNFVRKTAVLSTGAMSVVQKDDSALTYLKKGRRERAVVSFE